MKKKQKIWARLLSIMLCILLIVSVLPANLIAAEFNTADQSSTEQMEQEINEVEMSEQEEQEGDEAEKSEQKESTNEQEEKVQIEGSTEDSSTIMTEESSTQVESSENTSVEEQVTIENTEVVKSTKQEEDLPEVQEENDSTAVAEQNTQEETTGEDGIDNVAETNLNNPRIVEDSSMEAGQKVTWDCVWFGSYPQSEITSSDAVYNELKNATGWDTNNNIIIDGNRYRRMKKDDAIYAASGEDGQYNWSDSMTYHYFKYEPIKWRVLNVSDGQALLLADVVLDNQKYNLNYTKLSWENSSIRSWLNGYDALSNEPKEDYTNKNFIDFAFSNAEQEAINKTSINDDGIKNLQDKIFLLSTYDVYNTDKAKSYGFAKDNYAFDEGRRSKSSTYAKAMGLSNETSAEYKDNCAWWLRSLYAIAAVGEARVSCILTNGVMYLQGSNIDNYVIGVRPVLNLNLSYSNLYSYAGTVCSDKTKDNASLKLTRKSSVITSTEMDEDLFAIYAEIEPADARQEKVIWSSSNPDVVDVGETAGYLELGPYAFLTPKKNGEAIITAETENGLKATYKITVQLEEDENIKEQEEYIQAHLDFIENNDIWYSESKNSAKKFLEGDSNFKYLPSDTNLQKTWLAVTGNLSENPYDIILSDLVLDKENVDQLNEVYEENWFEMSEMILDDFLAFFKKYDININAEVQNEIEKLIKYNNVSDTSAYRAFDNIFGGKVNESKLEEYAETYLDVRILKKFFDRGSSIGETIFKILNHITIVKAFQETSKEFEEVLSTVYKESMDDPLMREAISNFNNMKYEDIDDQVFRMVMVEGTKQGVLLGLDIFGEALKLKTRNYLFKVLKVSTGGAAVASKVNAFLAGCEIGYDIGTTFCDMFLNITNISEATVYATYACKFTNQLRSVSEKFGENLKEKRDFNSARLFCEAYTRYREMQFKSIKALTKYRDAVQDAAWSQIADGLAGRKKEFAIISAITVENVNWYDKPCHKEGEFEDIMNDRFLVTIKCPVNVVISDKQGNIVAEIVDDEVSSVQHGVAAFNVNSHKYILLPDKDYVVRIEATDRGTMYYGVYRCQQDGTFIEGAIFENILLEKGKVFNGNLPINTEPPVEKFALMTDNKIVESNAMDFKDAEDTPITVPEKTQIISCDNSSKGMELTWNKVDEAEGYQIQYDINKSFKSATSLTVKGANTVSKVISGLTVNKKYYVRVRAYKTVNNKKYYAKWSDIKEITIKEVDKPVSTKVKNFVNKYVSSGSGKVYTEANIGNYVQILKGISTWNSFTSTEQKQANQLISAKGKVNYKGLYNAAEKIRKQCIADDGGNLASIPMTATGKTTSTQLTWSSVKGADGYYIYANRCNKGDKKYKWKCVKTIKSGSTVTYTHKNLIKNTGYKYRVGAYATINGKKVLIARSLILHSYTTASSPKYKNPSKVTVSNEKISLKVGKTKKVTAKISGYTKGKKISNHVVKIRYIISDPAIASISLSGTMKAKKAGSCTIWACAQNGVRKAIKVTVTK